MLDLTNISKLSEQSKQNIIMHSSSVNNFWISTAVLSDSTATINLEQGLIDYPRYQAFRKPQGKTTF